MVRADRGLQDYLLKFCHAYGIGGHSGMTAAYKQLLSLIGKEWRRMFVLMCTNAQHASILNLNWWLLQGCFSRCLF